MATPRNQVGFECEFVQDPPQWLQTECPICLHILREPYQVTCCGKSFCRLCIERVKGDHKPCPCCNENDFNDYSNKGLQQPLYGFNVYCSKREKGCEWKGELGQLDKHLNLNPQDDNELEGCEFAEIECSYCSSVIVRSQLLHHKKELCDKRPFSCEYCNEYESTYDDVVHNHWPVCGCHPVQCPNECGAFPQRQMLDDHVENECPLTVVECHFHYAGCEVKLPRRSMPDHLKDGLVTHFSLLAVSHKQQQELLKQQQELLKRQEDEIKTLTEEMNELKLQTKQLRLHTQIFPVNFVVENPYSYMLVTVNPWSSTSFYSHSKGYKLSLAFYRAKRWSQRFFIRCHLMHGEFDGLLKWPLKAVMKFRLLHQQAQGDDYESSIELDHQERLEAGAGDTSVCGRLAIGRSIVDQYMHNSCLHIRIVGVHF